METPGLILGVALGIGVWVQLVLIERRLSEAVERLDRLLAELASKTPTSGARRT